RLAALLQLTGVRPRRRPPDLVPVGALQLVALLGLAPLELLPVAPLLVRLLGLAPLLHPALPSGLLPLRIVLLAPNRFAALGVPPLAGGVLSRARGALLADLSLARGRLLAGLPLTDRLL